MFKFLSPPHPESPSLVPPTDTENRREEFKVHVRFPGKRVLLGWSHPEGITLMALREPSVSEPVVRGKVFQTLEFNLDTPITEVWQGASVLVASHLS